MHDSLDCDVGEQEAGAEEAEPHQRRGSRHKHHHRHQSNAPAGQPESGVAGGDDCVWRTARSAPAPSRTHAGRTPQTCAHAQSRSHHQREQGRQQGNSNGTHRTPNLARSATARSRGPRAKPIICSESASTSERNGEDGPPARRVPRRATPASGPESESESESASAAAGVGNESSSFKAGSAAAASTSLQSAWN